MIDYPHSPLSPGALTIRALPGCAGLALIGDADLTARDTWRAALATLTAGSSGEIHLDLAGLRFIDVACTRELFAITDRQPAVRLIVHHPPAILLRITALAYPRARVEFSQAPCPGAHLSPLPPDGILPPDGTRDSARALRNSGRPNHSPAKRPKTAAGMMITESPRST